MLVTLGSIEGFLFPSPSVFFFSFSTEHFVRIYNHHLSATDFLSTRNRIAMLRSSRSILAISRNVSSKNSVFAIQTMNFGTSEKKGSIMNAWNASCYHEMDFSIPENSTVFEAVERFAAYDIGALVTTDENGKFGLRSSVIRTKSAPNISSSSK